VISESRKLKHVSVPFEMFDVQPVHSQNHFVYEM